MNQQRRTGDWGFLVGYPWTEAHELLVEEGMAFQMKLTAAPRKVSSKEDAYVIAVRNREPLEIICASPDWTVGGGSHGQK